MASQQVCALAQEPAVASGLAVELITDPREFAGLGKAWDSLATQAGTRSPFLSHAWLTTWWECFGAGKDLRIFIVKSGREWLAAAPMMVHTASTCGIALRRLDSIYNYHVPRFEFLMKSRRPEIYRMLWQAMSGKNAEWDVITFQQFLSTSPTLNEFEALAQSDGWLTGRWEAPPSPFIAITGTYDDLLMSLHRNMRKNLRRRHSKLVEIAPVYLEQVTSPDEVPAALVDGFRIEAAAWKSRERTAILNDPDVQEFYTRFAQRAARLGWLKLIFLRVGDQRVAFNYVLDLDRVLYGVKIGYDPEFQTYSPGHLLRGLTLKEACDKGYVEYDFLGAADEWKLAWTQDLRRHQWLFLFRDRPTPRIVHRAKFVLVPAIRRLPALARFAQKLLGRKPACSPSNE